MLRPRRRAATIAVVTSIACGGGAPPAPRPRLDYALEAESWCRGRADLSGVCGELHGGDAATGVYVGLSYPTDGADPDLSRLERLADGTWYLDHPMVAEDDLRDEVARQIRACMSVACPEGPALPAPVYDELMTRDQRSGWEATQGDAGHVHVHVPSPHGSRDHDLVRSDHGAGWWVVATGSLPDPVRSVAVHVAVPPRRGDEPPPSRDLWELAAPLLQKVPALADAAPAVGRPPLPPGDYIGLAYPSANPVDPSVAVVRLEGETLRSSYYRPLGDDGVRDVFAECIARGESPGLASVPRNLEKRLTSPLTTVVDHLVEVDGHLHGESTRGRGQGQTIVRQDLVASGREGVWLVASGNRAEVEWLAAIVRLPTTAGH